jgi:hypothetical protein
MARELIRDRQRKTDENQKEQPGFPFSPKDPDSQDNEDRVEIPRFRHERHEPIEEGILPLLIDQTKKSYIQRSKKGKHRFNLSSAENPPSLWRRPLNLGKEEKMKRKIFRDRFSFLKDPDRNPPYTPFH